MAPYRVTPASTVDQDGPAGPVLTGAGQRITRRAQSRWLVHLWLVGTFVGSLAALVLTTGLTVHILLGLSFVGLVAVHVGQRRQTSARLLAHLIRVRSWVRPRGRLAWSDLILAFLTMNVLASGLVDWLTGRHTALPLSALGLHVHFIGWHGASAIVLLAYLVVHVYRRRRRLRNSAVR
jgi:hypothetical protein